MDIKNPPHTSSSSRPASRPAEFVSEQPRSHPLPQILPDKIRSNIHNSLDSLPSTSLRSHPVEEGSNNTPPKQALPDTPSLPLKATYRHAISSRESSSLSSIPEEFSSDPLKEVVSYPINVVKSHGLVSINLAAFNTIEHGLIRSGQMTPEAMSREEEHAHDEIMDAIYDNAEAVNRCHYHDLTFFVNNRLRLFEQHNRSEFSDEQRTNIAVNIYQSLYEEHRANAEQD